MLCWKSLEWDCVWNPPLLSAPLKNGIIYCTHSQAYFQGTFPVTITTTNNCSNKNNVLTWTANSISVNLWDFFVNHEGYNLLEPYIKTWSILTAKSTCKASSTSKLSLISLYEIVYITSCKFCIHSCPCSKHWIVVVGFPHRDVNVMTHHHSSRRIP